RDTVVEAPPGVAGGDAEVRVDDPARRAILPAAVVALGVALEEQARDAELAGAVDLDVVAVAEVLLRVGVIERHVALVAEVADVDLPGRAAGDGGDARLVGVAVRIGEAADVQTVGDGERLERRRAGTEEVE